MHTEQGVSFCSKEHWEQTIADQKALIERRGDGHNGCILRISLNLMYFLLGEIVISDFSIYLRIRQNRRFFRCQITTLKPVPWILAPGSVMQTLSLLILKFPCGEVIHVYWGGLEKVGWPSPCVYTIVAFEAVYLTGAWRLLTPHLWH